MNFAVILRSLTAVCVLFMANMPAKASQIVITGVTVIDTAASTAHGARKPNQAIVIDRERIAWVGPQSQLRLPAKATVINGRGKYAVPAFWDMHVHVTGPAPQQRATLLMLLANGVTNVRDMGHGNDPTVFRALQERLLSGAEAGPRIVATPMRLTDGPLGADKDTLADPAEGIFYPKDAKGARDLVDYVAKNRIAFIKPYDRLPKPTFLALMAEARRRGVVVGGHNPQAVSVSEIAEAGMKSLEHARALPWNCAPDGDSLRRAYDLGTTGKGPVPDGKKLQNDTRFLQATIAGFDEQRCRRIARVMKQHGLYYVPTHMTRRLDAFASIPEVRDSPLLRFIDPEVREWWKEDLAFYGQTSTSDRAAYTAFHYHALMVTRLAFEEGVPILVGTDTPDSGVFPGFSFHQEMRELVSAGIPALDVLKSATITAAGYFKKEGEQGSITPGKMADILLLDADPLADISNSERIFLLMKGGVAYDHSRIRGLFAEAEAVVSASAAKRQATAAEPEKH